MIRPLSEAARQWLDELEPAPAKAGVVAEPWQWVEGALAVDHRFARDLVQEIAAAGFEICR